MQVKEIMKKNPAIIQFGATVTSISRSSGPPASEEDQW